MITIEGGWFWQILILQEACDKLNWKIINTKNKINFKQKLQDNLSCCSFYDTYMHGKFDPSIKLKKQSWFPLKAPIDVNFITFIFWNLQFV